MTSLPPRATITSCLGVPTILSLPAVPTIVAVRPPHFGFAATVGLAMLVAAIDASSDALTARAMTRPNETGFT